MKGHLGIPKNMLKRLRTIMVFVTYQHLNGNKRLTNSKPTKKRNAAKHYQSLKPVEHGKAI